VVERARVHRSRFLVKFEGVADREGAEGLRGNLFVDASSARPLGEDEYWPSDLIGCWVQTPDGAEVGEVVDVLAGPAQDLLTVTTESGERFVPLVKEIVVRVDVARRTLTVDAPPGLLD
jgi:16S rRNA processing protein RimM